LLTTFFTEELGMNALAEVDAVAANAKITKAFFMVDMLKSAFRQNITLDFLICVASQLRQK